jgi:hypothetical protein
MNATWLKALVALAASSHSVSWFGNLVPDAGSIPHKFDFRPTENVSTPQMC